MFGDRPMEVFWCRCSPITVWFLICFAMSIFLDINRWMTYVEIIRNANKGIQTMFLDIDNSRSYATEANLLTALDKLGLGSCRPLVVCNRAGRFTAIFQDFTLRHNNLSVAYAASSGFKVMG